jgi:hypothetical protein
MYISSPFTNAGVPQIGLFPTIRIRKISDNALVVTDAAMIEVGEGWYKYDFVGYDPVEGYTIRCDGGAGLPVNERYTFAGNSEPSESLIASAVWDEMLAGHSSSGTAGKIVVDALAAIEIVKLVETGRWKIFNNQMIFYAGDGSTPLLTFNLKDSAGNPTMQDVFERDPA